jgi:SAM-dependent methyltransferase
LPELAALGRKARILDAGCGAGRLSAVLSEAGLVPIAVDRSPAALARGFRCSAYEVAIRAELASAPFVGGALDAAVALFTSLGHDGSSGLEEELRELGRVLKPGAPLVVDLPEPGHLARTFEPFDERRIGGLRVRSRRRLSLGPAGIPEGVSKRVEIRRGGFRVDRWFEHLELLQASALHALAERVGLESVRILSGERVPGFDASRLLLVARAPRASRSLS